MESKRVPRAVAVIAVAALLVAGAALAGAQAAKAPVPIKIFRMANTIDPQKDPIMLELQRRTNTKIEIVTAPWDQWINKLNLIMSSGEEMDIIMIDPSNPWEEWAREGLVYCVDDFVKDKKAFPYVYSLINSETFKGFKIDGKDYYIGGAHHGYDYALYLRQDWMDKLKLKAPKNEVDLYNILKAFKTQDPDGNGKDDTVGYAASCSTPGEFTELAPLFTMFGGAVPEWKKKLIVDNGKVVDQYTTKNSLDAIKYINRLYREGILNTDFLTQSETANKYTYANKAGAAFITGPMRTVLNLRKIASEAKLLYVPPLSAVGHTYISMPGPVWWLLVAVPKTCKNPQKAFELIEYLNSEEGRQLMIAGVKGRHYSTIKSGVYDRNKDNWEADYGKNNGYDNPLWWGFTSTVHGYIPAKDYKTWEEAYDHIQMYNSTEDSGLEYNWSTSVAQGNPYMRPNPFTLVTVSSVEDMRTKLYNDVIAVYYTKMLIADNPADIDGLWAKYLDEYKKAGGDQYVKAYQVYYDKYLKN
jgi:ABC-type sugar transport system, periplasmic component